MIYNIYVRYCICPLFYMVHIHYIQRLIRACDLSLPSVTLNRTTSHMCQSWVLNKSAQWQKCKSIAVTCFRPQATQASSVPWCPVISRWRHQMETFSPLLAIFGWNSPVTGEFPSQKPVTRSFYVFFDLCLEKRLNKQSRRRWFEKPLRSLWRHPNDYELSNLV